MSMPKRNDPSALGAMSPAASGEVPAIRHDRLSLRTGSAGGRCRAAASTSLAEAGATARRFNDG